MIRTVNAGNTLETLYRKNDGIEVHEMKDGFILYNPSSDTVHFMNHSAMVIWELCTGNNSVHAIGAMIDELYELDMQSGDMVRKTLEDLASLGLIIA